MIRKIARLRDLRSHPREKFYFRVPGAGSKVYEGKIKRFDEEV